MPTPPITASPRAPAWVAVALLHAAVLGWLARDLPMAPRQRDAVRVALVVEPTRPLAALARPPRARAHPAQSALRVLMPPLPVPDLPTLAPPGTAPVPSRADGAATNPAPSASLPSPALDLRLPEAARRSAAPATLHDTIRADGRANSPRLSAETRMAHALGGAGWQVTEMEGGARKVQGPFGECYISRPSLVNDVPGHPLAGLVPGKTFSCGGIEKGSLRHERPK